MLIFGHQTGRTKNRFTFHRINKIKYCVIGRVTEFLYYAVECERRKIINQEKIISREHPGEYKVSEPKIDAN